MIRPNKEERIKFNVDYPPDTEFSAYARLLQSKWRIKKGYPELKLGNFIETEFAKTSKTNFLTENIKNLIVKELDLATKYFKKLFPNRIDTITSVKFEYSPGRGDSKQIGDHSAFDVFVEFEKREKKGFIGIEVKYAESLREESKQKAEKNFKQQYQILSESSGIFRVGSVEYLKQPPLSQIWRDHLLCISTRQDYDEGFFVFLFPANNKHCQQGVDDYILHLASNNEEKNLFYPRYLDDFINTLINISRENWIFELKERYLGNE